MCKEIKPKGDCCKQGAKERPVYICKRCNVAAKRLSEIMRSDASLKEEFSSMTPEEQQQLKDCEYKCKGVRACLSKATSGAGGGRRGVERRWGVGVFCCAFLGAIPKRPFPNRY